MRVPRILSKLCEVEDAMAVVYGWLQEWFASDKDAARLFSRLSLQERSHLSLITYARRMMRAAEMQSSEIDLYEEQFEQFSRLVKDFRQQHQSPSLAEALRFAHTMEHHAAESLHRAVATAVLPEMADLLNKLGSEDARHVAEIVAFAESRSIDLYQQADT